MKKISVLAAILATSVSAFAFTPGMTAVQISNEVAQRVAANESNDTIAAAAAAAGLPGTVVQTALVNAGRNSTAVFNALVTANYSADSILPPTAAGPTQPQTVAVTQPPVVTTQPQSSSSDSSFSVSRSATVGGGGKASVSGS